MTTNFKMPTLAEKQQETAIFLQDIDVLLKKAANAEHYKTYNMLVGLKISIIRDTAKQNNQKNNLDFSETINTFAV